MPVYHQQNPPTPRAGYAPDPVELTTATTDDAVAADMARRATAAGAIPVEDVQAGLVVRLRRTDEVIDTVDLEKHLYSPLAPRGAAVHADPAGFANYVRRLANEHTTVWADVDQNRITAVFNDHATADEAGWRDHTATLRAQLDDEWTAWAERSGKMAGQEVFAEFVEEHYSAIDGAAKVDGKTGPSAADMLEIATTFQARRSAQFERATRLQSGDVQLRWTETTTATAGTKGTLDVPQWFAIKVRPYRGVDPVTVVCLLRYRIREGLLSIGYQMHRRDEILRDAFATLTDTVATGLGGAAPMYAGHPPPALR